MDSAGDFVIAYQGYDSNSHGVFAQRYNASGAAQGSTFRVNTPQQDNQGAPVDRDGFRGRLRDRLAGRRHDPDRRSLRAAVQLVRRGPREQYRDQHGLRREPTPRSPWSRPASTSSPGNSLRRAPNPGIEVQRFGTNGNALTGVVPLSSSEDYFQLDPAVAIDSEGDFLVAWESYGQGSTASSDATIIAQRVNSGGTLIGPTQFLPSTQSGDSQTAPKIASGATGNAIIVWQSKPSATSDSQNVYGRLYDYVNNAPTINTPSNLTINENAGQQTVNLTGITAGGGETQTLAVTASSNNTALVTPTITYTSPNSTGTLTFTPAANSFGTATITVTVTDNGGTANGGVDQTSVQFTVKVESLAPTIDTPSNVTINENAGEQTVDLTGITVGNGGTQTLTVTASSNNTSLISPTVNYTSPNSTGTLTFTPAANSFGSATITVTVSDNSGSTSVQFTVTVDQVAATVNAVSADWGTSGTIALQTAADGLRLLPAGRNTDLPWYGINKLQIALSQPESLSPGDVSVTGITVANYGPVTISGSGTNYTITFAQAITTADRVTVTIGNAGIATYTRRLDVLPGDVNDDGVVNATDLVLTRNNFAALGAVYNIFYDINGDGTVDVNDVNLEARFVGKKLPSLPRLPDPPSGVQDTDPETVAAASNANSIRENSATLARRHLWRTESSFTYSLTV